MANKKYNETKMKILSNFHLWMFVKALAWQTASTILKFPFVYYASGLKKTAFAVYQKMVWYEKFFGVKMSLRTLFTPLYGDYTRSGLLVGILIRFWLLIFRSLAFVIVALVLAGFLMLYLTAPFLIIWFILNPYLPLGVWIKIQTLY